MIGAEPTASSSTYSVSVPAAPGMAGSWLGPSATNSATQTWAPGVSGSVATTSWRWVPTQLNV